MHCLAEEMPTLALNQTGVQKMVSECVHILV